MRLLARMIFRKLHQTKMLREQLQPRATYDRKQTRLSNTGRCRWSSVKCMTTYQKTLEGSRDHNMADPTAWKLTRARRKGMQVGDIQGRVMGKIRLSVAWFRGWVLCKWPVQGSRMWLGRRLICTASTRSKVRGTSHLGRQGPESRLIIIPPRCY